MPGKLIAAGKTTIILPSTTITAAVAGVTTGSVGMSLVGANVLTVEAIFTYGSGGTTAKFWVQTKIAGGNWTDIMSFAFTTASADKFSTVCNYIALAGGTARTDAALADNTILNGLLGDQIQVKYTTTGTYAGGTTIQLIATTKP
jgi:hypothetical protein